tara:strand:- start:107 stop:502 length:396 start_codon:yes stop_codon:yes gene_type:complete
MNELEEGIRLKSWDEWKAGAAAAADRLNRHVVQPATKFIKDRLPKSSSPSPAPRSTSTSRPRATGGPEGVGTKDDNTGAVRLSVGNDPGLDRINRQAQQSTKRNYPNWWREKGPSGTAWYGQQQFRRDLTK